jgi:uncharacterized protein (TIGR01777 family)
MGNMHVLITGGTGFIGSVLTGRLVQEGHAVTILSRSVAQNSRDVTYIQALQAIDSQARIDAIVNLAGASLGDRRWSKVYKEEIVSSRLDTTRAVLDLVARLERKPEVLVSASAIGFYGHHGDEQLAEDGPVTPGFAQDLCARWEQLAQAATGHGVRVCLARLGVVLDQGGGPMEKMALPLRLGVASWMGDGKQWMSWVHRQDVVEALMLLLQRKDLSGPFNITAPGAVTSREFCNAMKRRRRTVITAPVPAVAMRLMLGEMAGEILLNGQRVVPARLQDAGFEFRYPDVDSALCDIL